MNKWAMCPSSGILMLHCLQASSPDEEALVQGAALLGFRLISRSLSMVSAVD